MKENIKSAIESAEKEIQEREIASLKKIVKDLLESKVLKEEKKREIEKEISIIKQTIDDFKAGRLDKVKELIEKDGIAKEILPFNVKITNQPILTKPWIWDYQITPTTVTTYAVSNGSGTNYATFTSGTYSIGGKIINL